MTKRLKGAAMKRKGNPVRETPAHVEPDEHGNRRQRRLWQRRYGKRAGQPNGGPA
jgi:hypothetical protein